MTLIDHPVMKKTLPDGRSYADIFAFLTGTDTHPGYKLKIDTANGAHILQGGKSVLPPWIPEAFTQPEIVPRIQILHTNAGGSPTRWAALWAWIRRIDVVKEAHHQVDRDGTIAQIMPLNRRADCNYKANKFYIGSIGYGAISFETGDLGAATVDTTLFTTEQVETLVKVLALYCIAYNIACTACPTWTDTGIDYHSKFANLWTNVVGKSCPGKAKIRQMDYIRSQVAHLLSEFGGITGWNCRGLGG